MWVESISTTEGLGTEIGCWKAIFEPSVGTDLLGIGEFLSFWLLKRKGLLRFDV